MSIVPMPRNYAYLIDAVNEKVIDRAMYNALMARNDRPSEVLQRAERLKTARELRYDSAADAARALRIAYPTYAGHENGTTGFKAKASLYARKFGVRLEWLWEGTEPMLPDEEDEVVALAKRIAQQDRNTVIKILRGFVPDGED